MTIAVERAAVHRQCRAQLPARRSRPAPTRGARARSNGARASPPPPHNFDAIPVVHGREPLWEPPRNPRYVAGLAADAREVLVDDACSMRCPIIGRCFPSPSIWPFVSAVATTVLFIGSIFTPWAVVWGSVPVAIALIALVLAEARPERARWRWSASRERMSTGDAGDGIRRICASAAASLSDSARCCRADRRRARICRASASAIAA